MIAHQESRNYNSFVNQSSPDTQQKLKPNSSLRSISNERNSSDASGDISSVHSFGLNNFNKISILPPQQKLIQSKLKINKPGDQYEREADRMADYVMHMPTQQKSSITLKNSRLNNFLQRKYTTCEGEQDEEKEGILMRKSLAGGGFEASAGFAAQLNATRGGGFPLPMATRSFMENAFIADFSRVRVHTDSQTAEMSQVIQAKAFTHGSDIYFNQGLYSPETSNGKRLLGHELTHVVQQSGEKKLVQMAPKEVDIPDKGRICKAKREYKILEKSAPPSVKFDIDSANITLNIKWCKGKNLGEIKIGANVPEQAVKVAKDIIDIVRQGGGSSQIEERLRNTNLTPFLDAVIKQGRAFSITAHGEITVDPTGVIGGKGSLDLDLGMVTISPNVEANKELGWKVGLDLKIPLPFGSGKVEDVKCKTEKVRIGKKLTCECPTPAKTVPSMKWERIPPETRFLYFDYNSANINEEHSAKSISEIKELLGEGYQVKRIAGFTSPEGTLLPSPGFEGNKILAERRAEQARIRIDGICSPLNMRDFIKCDSNVMKEVKQVGIGELHSSDEEGKLLKDEKGKELEGKDLAKVAIKGFEKSEKQQQHLGVLTEKERKGLAKARTAEEKSKFIYRLLRRVEITFEKTGMHEVPVEITIPPGKEPCPPKVLKQAKEKLPQWAL